MTVRAVKTIEKDEEILVSYFNGKVLSLIIFTSVADPDPPDLHVFGPPGSGSASQRYGSRSGSCSGSGSGYFYHHAKMKKNLDSYYFVTLFDFYL